MSAGKTKRSSVRFMVVPDGNAFPAFRTTACCDKQTKAGQSVMIFRTREVGSKLDTNHIFHRECLSNFVEEMPLSRQDIRSKGDRIKERILATGEPYPD